MNLEILMCRVCPVVCPYSETFDFTNLFAPSSSLVLTYLKTIVNIEVIKFFKLKLNFH